MDITIIFQIVILVFSVVVHEVSHGWAAYLLGDQTAKFEGRLTLNPIPHLDLFGSILLPALMAFSNLGIILGWAKPVPFNPYNLGGGKWGPSYVAVAGPASNILIAIVFGLLIRLAPSMDFITPGALLLAQYVVLINLVLAIFNLIPVPPLDGSKILFAALPYRWRGIEEWMTRYQIFLFFFVLFFILQLVFPIVLFFFKIITGTGF